MPDPLMVTRTDGIVRLTLSDPERHNALGPALIATLQAELERAAADDAARAAVLDHEGPVFCAGADLDGDPRGGADGLEALIDLLQVVRAFPKPLVMTVAGPARGAGVALVALADFVIATDAADFATPEVRLGLPPTVVAPVLMATIGPAAARELLLTGRTLTADEAAAVGLVHRRCDPQHLATTRDTLLQELRRAAPAAQQAAKALLGSPFTADLSGALDAVAARTAELLDAAEAAEGLAAWRERRRPLWMGDTR